MPAIASHLPDLVFAFTAYLVATVSPGPANLAIMATSMREGRRAGVSLALGVLLGSLTWGTLAALGLSAFLTSYGWLASGLRVAGGLYLLWLAYKSLRAALRSHTIEAVATATREPGAARHFGRGLAIHLTNPKSIFAWLAIIAIGVGPGAPAWISILVVGGCWLLGIGVFGGYALAFSSQPMVALYASFRRWIEGTAAAVFGLAGLKLLTLRP